MSEPAIVCRALTKRFGDVIAVDGLDLSIERGECFGLLGPNGAGKTTTIEILEGLTRPDAGEVTVLGSRWNRGNRALRQRLGISLQETRLNEKLTVEEIVRVFRSFYRNGPSPDEVISRMSLDEKRTTRAGKLSGGQRQRLAVACAIVGSPEILFLDEPTTGLDPQSRLQLWDIVHEFRTKGGTILLTTHYMDEAERLCDRVAVIDHGKLLALGTPAELIARLHAPYVVEFSSAPELSGEKLAALEGVETVRRRGEMWSLNVSSLARGVPALLSEIEESRSTLSTLSTHQATLEDVFVSLTGRELRDA